ncbi:MAG: S41 family peptidase [Phaeodactylibacter sp.]|nr:S41 family peptidase [Phaeodactylibacter sp.]
MMKQLMLGLCLCGSILAIAQEPISSSRLLEDFALLKSALLGLHPGLYRYEEPAVIEGYFEDLARTFQEDLTLEATYLELSKFLARLKDGHTYPNFWNQPDTIKNALFRQADKVPFTFEFIGEQLIVLKDGSLEGGLSPGTEVLTINAVPVSEIVDSLLLLVRGDGSNRAQRVYELQLSGFGEYEAFDVYFPLLFPPMHGLYRIGIRDQKTGDRKTVELQAVTRTARSNKIAERYGQSSVSYDDLWQLEFLSEHTAYLKLGSFVTWKMELNWRQFLKKAFVEMHDRKTEHLILDIRGNGGGLTAVYLEVLRYLTPAKIQTPPVQALMRYDHVPDTLRPYLDTWDAAIFDPGKKVRLLENGYYQRKGGGHKTIRPKARHFRGDIYVLIDPANSSATFNLAQVIQREQLGTLVGQPTGGNLKGITGGELFFLNLPNTGIEVDIPLIAGFPMKPQPDRGIVPDVWIRRTMEAVRAGRDLEMERVLRDLDKK